jgi:hypothetical protein
VSIERRPPPRGTWKVEEVGGGRLPLLFVIGRGLVRVPVRVRVRVLAHTGGRIQHIRYRTESWCECEC